jgi:hypothetical protein
MKKRRWWVARINGALRAIVRCGAWNGQVAKPLVLAK